MLLEHFYKNSVLEALKFVFPERKWRLWQSVENVPNGFWKDRYLMQELGMISQSEGQTGDEQNSKMYFDWLGIRLEYKQLEAWYQVTFEQIVQNHGGGLLKHFDNSPYLALKVCMYTHCN